MIYIIIPIVLGFIFVTFGMQSCSYSSGKDSTQVSNPTDTIKKKLTREEIKNRLEELSKAPKKKELSPGAMCYEPMMMPDKADYVCPACLAKTIHTSDNAQMVQFELPGMRQYVKEIKGLDIKLDETSFCKKCSADKKTDEAKACLIVTYADGGIPYKICNISKDDCCLLKEFSEGSLVHRYGNDAETPIQDHMARLEKLLGVSLK
ncbi:MAG: hypothetical protein V2A54_16915 [Bacteroidota bacterium]